MFPLSPFFLSLVYLLASVAALPPPFGGYGGQHIFTLNHTQLTENEYVIVYHSRFNDSHIDRRNDYFANHIKKRNLNKRSLSGNTLSTEVHPIKIRAHRSLIVEADKDTIDHFYNSEEVAYIQRSPVATAFDTVIQRKPTPPYSACRLSSGAQPCGSDRKYVFDDIAGRNTYGAVLDTGVDYFHPQLKGRVRLIGNAIPGEQHIDYSGHGTHVAGIIAGFACGIAKNAVILSCKCLNRFGKASGGSIMKCLQITIQYVKSKGIAKQTVINMSLGMGNFNPLNAALKEATELGILIVAAAGNENKNCQNVSPASSQRVMTVGAVDQRDQRAGFSNYGKCVNINFPGVNVPSLGPNKRENVPMTGTSMSCPGITGHALCELALSPKGTSAYSLFNKILKKGQSCGARAKRIVGGTTSIIACNEQGVEKARKQKKKKRATGLSSLFSAAR